MLMCVCIFIFSFQSAHLIASIADTNEEYIFPGRPAQQRPITQKNLNSFYHKLMEAANKEGVIRKYYSSEYGGNLKYIDISNLDKPVSFQL